MMNNISWGSYWSVVIICVILYYGYVLLVYYRSDLTKRFQPAPQVARELNQKESSENSLLPAVISMTDEMKAWLEQIANTGATKPEIIFGLQQIAKKYKIKDSPYQNYAVKSLLEFENKNKSVVHLSEEEFRQVWMV